MDMMQDMDTTSRGLMSGLRKALLVLGPLAVLGLAVVAFSAFARHSFTVGPATVSARLAPSVPGSTSVALPPFGTVSAPTHREPVRVLLTIDQVDVDALQSFALAGVPEQDDLERLRDDLARGILVSALAGLAAAALTALLGALALRLPRGLVAGCVAVAVVVPGAVLWVAASRFDAEAFRQPRFEGTLRYAPALADIAQERALRVEDVRRQVSRTAGELAAFYRSPESFSFAGDLSGTFRVLHVSDLHLDPVGLTFAQDVASSFECSAVVNTGDVNTYGSSIEASTAARFLGGLPTVFVPGNHESPVTIERIAAVPDVSVVTTPGSVEVAGLSVFCVPDPTSSRVDWTASPEEVTDAGRAAAAVLRRSGAAPEVVAVHSPLMAPAFEGLTRVVLTGHTHRQSARREGETWIVNGGTTGGVDFTELRTDPSIPHTVDILYFTADRPHRLIAIDQVGLYSEGETRLRRIVVDPALLERR